MTQSLVEYLASKLINKNDVRDGENGDPSPWRFATRIVTSNKEVNAINKSQIVRFAKGCGRPVYYWHCQPTGADGNADVENSMVNLATDVPETVQYFAQGAPCMITKNTYMKYGVANGTAGTMHSLTWADKRYRPRLPERYIPGQLIRVEQPYSINVELQVSLGLSKVEAVRVAKATGKPIFYWHDEPTGGISTAGNSKLGTVRYFVEGAQCKIPKRECSEHNLQNNSVATMISMTWKNGCGMRQVTRNAIAGRFYQVKQPNNVKVKLHSSNASGQFQSRRQNTITVETRTVVPMTKVSHQFTLLKYNPKTRKPGLSLQCYSHNVKLMFAITFHKSQGQTLSRVVLHLHKRPGRSLKNLTIQGLYVALSRVRLGSCIRVSYDSRTGLKYLTRLQRPKNFDLWVNNYDKQTGLWVPAGMSRLRDKGIQAARKMLKQTKNLNRLKLTKLVELARVLDVEISKNANGTKNKPEYASALYDEWCAVRGIKSTKSDVITTPTTAVEIGQKKETSDKIVNDQKTYNYGDQRCKGVAQSRAKKEQRHGESYSAHKQLKIEANVQVEGKRLKSSKCSNWSRIGDGDFNGSVQITPTKRSRIEHSLFDTPIKTRKVQQKERKGRMSRGAGAPLPLSNSHIYAPGKQATLLCYINSTLQLLESSKVCLEYCKHENGKVAQMLQCLHARDSLGTKKAMDTLISHLDKDKFPVGQTGCAMEFMSWCVQELGLNNIRPAVTRIVTEQICMTCKAVKFSTSDNNGYDDAMCEVNLIGDVAEAGVDQDYNVRRQQCWQNNVHKKKLCPSQNQMRFREIHYYGTVVIFRWGTHQKNPVCLQRQIRLITANATFTDSRVCTYCLRAYTVFYQKNKHYKTFRFVNGLLYCCDDSSIRVTHCDFSKPVGRCVMAIYDRANFDNNASVPVIATCAKKVPIGSGERFVSKNICSQVFSKTSTKSPFKDSLPNLPKCARKLVFHNDNTSLSAPLKNAKKTTWSSEHNFARKWVCVHGDGFCWIYAFLVAIGALHQGDFPNGDYGFGCSPSEKAIRLSKALAPLAFAPERYEGPPRFEHGNYVAYGTEGGHRHFCRLFARIRPSFRFFVLDQNHVRIKYAALLEVEHTLPNEIMKLFGPAPLPCAHVLEYASDGAAPLKLIFSAERYPRQEAGVASILCQETDVVVCWANAKHFNALSPGSNVDPNVARLLKALTERPTGVAELFPLEEPEDKSDYDNSGSDVEIL